MGGHFSRKSLVFLGIVLFVVTISPAAQAAKKSSKRASQTSTESSSLLSPSIPDDSGQSVPKSSVNVTSPKKVNKRLKKNTKDDIPLFDECGSPDNFLCANNKCIPMKWVCDNINDCSLNGDGDFSDEKDCEEKAPNNSTKKENAVRDSCQRETSFRCDSGHCIPPSYVCDGEMDCRDGSDEKPDCEALKNKCKKDEFQCQTEECISIDLKCNGKVDCMDGWSDESGCIESHQCHVDDGKFLCKSGDFCINASQVCDKKKDCKDSSDEYPGCELSCMNTTCSQGCLPDPNVNVTGSGVCYCYQGFAMSSRESGKCVDIDECNVFGTCSQLCTNLLGSHECSCINGFKTGKDNSSCVLIEKNPALIYAMHNGIRVHKMYPGHEHYYAIVEDVGSPVSISYDAKENWVFWTDVLDQGETIWRSKLDGSKREAIITTGMIQPEGIAYDWIADNIYFTDSNKSHIVVCTANGRNCSVLIQEQMDRPRDVAVHPNLGFLFWTDWGASPSIIKAGMDGSYPLPIITENVKWPNGITIDHGNSRLYWTDASTDRIETATLDGEDRRVVKSSGIKHPFGVDVLGDMVYWSDWNLYEIQMSNKFDGSNHAIIVKEPLRQLNDLAVFHRANQPSIRKNDCLNSGCSHICTLSPKGGFKCQCPSGFKLDQKNKRTCTTKRSWPHFVITYNSTLKIAPFEVIGGNVFREYEISGLQSIGAVATIPFNDSLFLSDLDNKRICHFDLKTEKLTTIVDKNLGLVKGLSYDEVGDNLYWVDSSNKMVEVLSLRTMTRVTLFKEIDRPMDIVVAPDIRSLFMIQKNERGAKLVKMNMNGFNRRVLQRRSGAEPMALTYNKDMRRLYWTDAASETIETIGVDGTSSYMAEARPGSPFGIASLRNRIFWTDRHTQTLKGKQLDTFSDERKIFFGSLQRANLNFDDNSVLAKVAIMNNEVGYDQKLLDNHDCASHRNQCSHVCLMSADELRGTCVCPDYLKLDSNGRTCIKLDSGELPTAAICMGGKCRKPMTTKKPSKTKTSKTTPSGTGKSTPESSSTEATQLDKTETSTSSSPDSFPEYSIEDGFSFEDDFTSSSSKSKKKSSNKNKNLDRDSRRGESLEYDEYDGGLPSNAALLPDGRIVYEGEAVNQLESDNDNNTISQSGHPVAIALGVIIILVLVGVIIGIILHRRNVHPKVLVRPYVQHWVRYVNQPVQRFFDSRGNGGEQLDGSKRNNIYDEVYHSPSDHTYSGGYANIDDLQDSSVHVYEDPDRINYSQKDRLIP